MWYSRPVFFVADIDRAVAFYAQIGFSEAWRHAEAGKALVAQLDQDGCEIILSSQSPEKVGAGMLFISLDPGAFPAFHQALKDDGVAFSEGHWGYRVLIVPDPDGNELYFPDPSEKGSP